MKGGKNGSKKVGLRADFKRPDVNCGGLDKDRNSGDGDNKASLKDNFSKIILVSYDIFGSRLTSVNIKGFSRSAFESFDDNYFTKLTVR